MAIRIEPPPALARLRLSWHRTWNQYLRSWVDLRDRVARRQQSALDGMRIMSARAAAHLSPRFRAEARHNAEYHKFLKQYEELVDLLCWAAKDGVHTDRDLRYARLRDWMQRHYHRVRPYLRPYLGPWEGPLDPFEELFAPECVDAVINSMDGIRYVMQTRSALDAYDLARDARKRLH